MRMWIVKLELCSSVRDGGSSVTYTLEAESEHDAVEAAMLNAILDRPGYNDKYHFWWADVSPDAYPDKTNRVWLTVVLRGDLAGVWTRRHGRERAYPWSAAHLKLDARSLGAIPSRKEE